LNPAPEPLLAPLEGHRWKLIWSSEDPCYGGSGTPAVETEQNWRIPAHATVVLTPEAINARQPSPGKQHGLSNP